MQVKDIMKKEVITVELGTKVADIAKILTSKGIHGVPVTNKKGLILGIITMSDFFIKGYPEIYLPSYIDFLQKTKFHGKQHAGEKASSDKLMKAKAEDIMTKDCVTVSEDMDIEDLLERYQMSSLKTIPVSNKEGKLAGIVTRSDIIKLIKV